MTDHASLLRQIRADARPYIEQALELAEVFTGFRKLASENGLDWGVIKALIKAEVQDEKEGGSEKVDRIIEKADFAASYADMLGLGTSNMNEENFSSEAVDPETGEIIEPASVLSETEAGQGEVQQGRASSVAPPINSEIHREPSNRDVSADGEASSAAASQGQAAHAGTGSETLASHEGDTQGEGASVLSPPIPEQNFDRSTGAVTVTTGDDGGQLSTDGSGDAVEECEQSEKVATTGKDCNADGLAVRAVQYLAGQGASSPALNSDPVTAPARSAVTAAAVEASPSLVEPPAVSFNDLEPPPFLKRGDPACAARSA